MAKKRYDDGEDNDFLPTPGTSFELSPPPDVLEPAEPEPSDVPVLEAPPAASGACINATLFARISNSRPSQMAGFLSYAKRKHLGPNTVEVWREIHEHYLNEIIG